LPLKEANVRVREYLHDHPLATSKMIAKAIGCSPAQVRKTASWKVVSAERKKRKNGTVRAGDCSVRAAAKAEEKLARERYAEEVEARDASLDAQEQSESLSHKWGHAGRR
jgi:hypothetical protein